MNRLIFLLEEPSIATLLDGLLSRLFPDVGFQCILHEGKSDLIKSLPRKLRAWKEPGARFIVLVDNDNKDCKALKRQLVSLCVEAGRQDTLTRIVCQELEAWYFGDPEALALAFDHRLGKIARNSRYRDPDSLEKPSAQLRQLCPAFQKVSGARAIAHHLSYDRNTSRSFRSLIDGIKSIRQSYPCGAGSEDTLEDKAL